MSNIDSNIVVVYIIAAVLFFTIIRYIVLWYYQIDRRVKQNDEIIRLLKKLNGEPIEALETKEVEIFSKNKNISGK